MKPKAFRFLLCLVTMLVVFGDLQAGTCRNFFAYLGSINRLEWLFPRVRISEIANKPLFTGSPIENFNKFLNRLESLPSTKREILSLPPQEIQRIRIFIQRIPTGFFDPALSETYYQKPKEEVKVLDALALVRKLLEAERSNFLAMATDIAVPGSLQWSSRQIRKSALFTLYAVGLAGLAYTVGGFGAPLWDPLGAWTRKYSFVAVGWVFPVTASASDRVSPVDPRFSSQNMEIYRRQNEMYSGVDQIVTNRLSYFETSIHQDLLILSAVSDPQVRFLILHRLQSLKMRFLDVLQSEGGDRAREALSYVQKTYDPDKNILRDLGPDGSESQDRK